MIATVADLLNLAQQWLDRTRSCLLVRKLADEGADLVHPAGIEAIGRLVQISDRVAEQCAANPSRCFMPVSSP